MLLAFAGASGMTSFVAGNTDTSACPNWYSAFAGLTNCSTFNAAGLDFSAATNLQATWANDPALATITGLDLSTAQVLQRGDEMFLNTPAGVSIDFSGIGIDKLLGWDNRTGNQRSLFDALSPTAVGSQAFYDQTLINFAAQLPTDNGLPTTEMFLGMGDTVYTTGGAAEAARLSLINAGWWITDAGNGVPEVASAPTLVVNGADQITATLPSDPFGNGRFVTGRALEYRIGAGAWTEFGSGYAEGQAVPVTGLTAETLYEIRGVFTNFDGSTNGTSASATTEVSTEFATNNEDGVAEFTVGEFGDVSITITGGIHAGTYTQRVPDSATLTTTMLEAAATAGEVVYFKLPTFDGTPTEDVELTGIPGLYISDADDPPVGDPVFQFQVAGVDVEYTGDLKYTPSTGEVGDNITLAETFTGVTVTSAAVAIVSAAPTVADAFVDANWSVSTGSGARELDITIATLPADGGSAITDIEYDVDASGTWVSLATAVTGTTTITMAAPSTSYAIRLRAVNGAGNAAAGNSESATSGVSAFIPADDPDIISRGTHQTPEALREARQSPLWLTLWGLTILQRPDRRRRAEHKWSQAIVSTTPSRRKLSHCSSRHQPAVTLQFTMSHDRPNR